MAGDLIQFVDTIASSPTVALDLNDQTTWAVSAFTAPPPRLRRSLATNTLAPGGTVASAVHEMRKITLKLELITDDQDTGATQLQALVRQLDKPRNIMRYQPVGATAPVFFRTYRSDVANIADIITAKTFRVIDIELLAEPYALGLPETPAALTYSNDPASATNEPVMADIGTIIGDVAAPLQCRTDNLALGQGTYSMLAHVAYASASLSGPAYFQAESGTLGTDTTSAANAIFSGGNGATVTFATDATLVARTTASVTLPYVGPYRVYARLQVGSSGAIYTLAVKQTSGTNSVTGDTVTCTGGVTATNILVDLGVHTFPHGGDTDEYSRPAALDIALLAGRTSGTGDLDLDYVLFVPVGGPNTVRSSLLYSYIQGGNEGAHVFDPETEQVYAYTPGTPNTVKTTPIEGHPVSGGFPWVAPGANNYVYFYPGMQGTSDTNNNTTLNFTYYPRYLFVRPATT